VTVAGEAGIKAVALKVAGAFHSALMQPAADAMKLELEKATLNKTSAPVYSNVTAALHTEPGEIKALLVKQIVAPVKWQQTMEGILAAEPEAKMIELSPGRTLTGLVKKINRRLAVVSLDEALLA
jgi:[acyl-carrier-protein] S-malonyltransferase